MLIMALPADASDPHPNRARYMSGQFLGADDAGYRVLMFETRTDDEHAVFEYDIRLESYNFTGELVSSAPLLHRKDTDKNGDGMWEDGGVEDDFAPLLETLRSGLPYGMISRRYEPRRRHHEEVVVDEKRGLWLITGTDTTRVFTAEEIQGPSPAFDHPTFDWPVHYVEHFDTGSHLVFHLRWSASPGDYDVLDWFVPISKKSFRERTRTGD